MKLLHKNTIREQIPVRGHLDKNKFNFDILYTKLTTHIICRGMFPTLWNWPLNSNCTEYVIKVILVNVLYLERECLCHNFLLDRFAANL